HPLLHASPPAPTPSRLGPGPLLASRSADGPGATAGPADASPSPPTRALIQAELARPTPAPAPSAWLPGPVSATRRRK
ncbi:protease, partial [Streptomyces scabiei]|nr:protease [Streptomyces scabiei]